jgi:hypothetical protein
MEYGKVLVSRQEKIIAHFNFLGLFMNKAKKNLSVADVAG